MIDILLYSHHLPAWYCINIVRRNYVLVTCGSERVDCYHSIIINLANNLFFNGKAFFRSIITLSIWLLDTCKVYWCTNVQEIELKKKTLKENPYILSFAKLIQNRECHVIIFQQMVGDSISNPRSPLSWPEFQQLVSSFLQQILNKLKKQTNKQILINNHKNKNP